MDGINNHDPPRFQINLPAAFQRATHNATEIEIEDTINGEKNVSYSTLFAREVRLSLSKGAVNGWFERSRMKLGVKERRELRSMYKHGSRCIFEAGSICGHAKVAVGKFNTDKMGGNADRSVGQGYRPSGEGPLYAQIRDDI